MSQLARGAVLVGVLLLIWLALNLILMLFAGILFAIFLRTLARLTSRYTGLSIGRALAVVGVALLAILVTGGALYAPRLLEQSDQLTQALPQAASDLTSWLQRYSWGQWVLQQFQSQMEDGNVASQATTVVRRIFDALIAFAVVLFTGLYFAAQPEPYIRGALYLVPPSHRVRAAETMYAIGHVLQWWLVGQALSMTVVGLAMGIGLSLIGVHLSFLLGVLAGLFEFVPLIGPVIALGPALMLALTEGTQQAALVLVLYAFVQTLESYLLTPLVQQRAVELPPVVTIAAQLALSWAAGPIGLIVAVPLTAALMVATQMLYVEDQLGDEEVAPDFKDEARREVAKDRRGRLRDVFSNEDAK